MNLSICSTWTEPEPEPEPEPEFHPEPEPERELEFEPEPGPELDPETGQALLPNPPSSWLASLTNLSMQDLCRRAYPIQTLLHKYTQPAHSRMNEVSQKVAVDIATSIFKTCKSPNWLCRHTINEDPAPINT